MAELMRQGEFLLAEDDRGRIVGSVYTEVRDERGYFGMLAVDPLWQGKGIGKLMVAAAENHCRKQGCVLMDISVLSLRRELLPFYHKLGYVESGTQEFHPSGPLRGGATCYCIIMSKSL